MVRPAAARPIGQYLVFDQIASGETATVHLGRLGGLAGFARTVAIKGLREQHTDDPEFVSMFLDEARLASRIHHPNVVPTLDVVQSEDGIFLVMEYVHGESLARLMPAMRSTQAACDVRIVATIMSGVLHGLHAAHEARDEQGHPLGIVHRDVSPQNVLVGVDGVPRVLDFGVAKALSHLQTRRKGQVKGKIAYMAPERVQNKPATRQSDVYAAAVVAWEMLAGQPLFPNNQAAILTAVLHAPIRPPSEVAGRVPGELDRVVLRGLERDPAQRYQTALEMALELERCAGTAPASEIGEWVVSLAHEELAKRDVLLAEIESVASGTRPAQTGRATEAVTVVERRAGAPSIVAVTPTPTSVRRPLGRPMLLGGIGAATGLLVLGAILLFSRTERGDAQAAATDPAASSPSAVTVTSSPTASSTLSDKAAGTEPPSASTSAGAIEPHTRPASSARRSPHAPPPPGCNPPFWIDEQGHKRYKPDCL